MACLSWWRSPRSIPTGQDGRRPLQHKLQVTYIYVLKCITHPILLPPPPPDAELPFSFRPLPTLPVSPSTRLHGHRTSSLLSVRVREERTGLRVRKRQRVYYSYLPTQTLQLHPFILPTPLLSQHTTTSFPLLHPLHHPLTPTSSQGDNIRTRC